MLTENSKKLIIIVVIFTVVFVTFFLLYWRPGFTKLRRYQRELSDKEAELVQLERDARDWPKSITRERLKEYEYELERLWDLIPSREEVAMLLDEIQTHARTSGLEIIALTRSVTPKRSTQNNQAGKEKEPKYVKVPYKISLGGSYFGLIGFLRKLEDSKRLVTIDSIKMDVGKGRHLMDAEIQFNIFYSRIGV